MVLGVGLRKLCPLDSSGYAFGEKKTVRKSNPGGCKTGPRGGPKWPLEGLRAALLCQLGPTWPPRPLGSRVWAALGALLGRLWRSWSRLGGLLHLLGRPGPLLGASWGSFGDLPRVDLNDLDVVCGLT